MTSLQFPVKIYRPHVFLNLFLFFHTPMCLDLSIYLLYDRLLEYPYHIQEILLHI